jgi:predicted RNase H-like HicB family nuclease
MTRKSSLVIEGVSMGYSAYVPELPTILVTGRSVEELTDRTAEAIRLLLGERPPRPVRVSRDRSRTAYVTMGLHRRHFDRIGSDRLSTRNSFSNTESVSLVDKIP